MASRDPYDASAAIRSLQQRIRRVIRRPLGSRVNPVPPPESRDSLRTFIRELMDEGHVSAPSASDEYERLSERLSVEGDHYDRLSVMTSHVDDEEGYGGRGGLYNRLRQTSPPKPTAKFFVLTDDGTPVPEPDALIWRLWINHSPRVRVQYEVLSTGETVDTSFIGASTHTPADDLWETAVKPVDDYHFQGVRTYPTADAARAGHALIVQLIRSKGGRAIRLRDEGEGWT